MISNYDKLTIEIVKAIKELDDNTDYDVDFSGATEKGRVYLANVVATYLLLEAELLREIHSVEGRSL